MNNAPTQGASPQPVTKPYTVVLDLDETLVSSFTERETLDSLSKHCGADFVRRIDQRKYEFELKTGADDSIWGLTRPGALEFVASVRSQFRGVGVWSAAGPEYVRHVVDLLFAGLPSGPDFVLTREDCARTKPRMTKPLAALYARYPGLATPENTIVLDDTECYLPADMANVLLVPPFELRPLGRDLLRTDNCLELLGRWLDTLPGTPTDARELDKSAVFREYREVFDLAFPEVYGEGQVIATDPDDRLVFVGDRVALWNKDLRVYVHNCEVTHVPSKEKVTLKNPLAKPASNASAALGEGENVSLCTVRVCDAPCRCVENDTGQVFCAGDKVRIVEETDEGEDEIFGVISAFGVSLNDEQLAVVYVDEDAKHFLFRPEDLELVQP